MTITVNGEVKEFDAELTLSEVLSQLVPGGEKIAVEVNKLVIRKKDWAETKLSQNDRLEIVHFVGGG